MIRNKLFASCLVVVISLFCGGGFLWNATLRRDDHDCFFSLAKINQAIYYIVRGDVTIESFRSYFFR